MFVLSQNEHAWFFNGTLFVPSLNKNCHVASVTEE